MFLFFAENPTVLHAIICKFCQNFLGLGDDSRQNHVPFTSENLGSILAAEVNVLPNDVGFLGCTPMVTSYRES